MTKVQTEWIDVVLAAVVGTIIMVVLLLLTRKPAKYDEKAASFGIVGIYVYRLGRLLANIFKRKNAEQKDVERNSQLKAIYDDLQKQTTKLKLKCPGCGRSLKGATEGMVGDVGVCPKCKAEFVIEQKDVKLRDEQKQ